MTLRHFFDTNILLYSISTDPTEQPKRDRAIELLDQRGGALSIQVLQEFYVQATRPARADAIPHDLAAKLLQSWTRFTVQDMTMSVLMAALDIKKEFGFSYWDSAIISAAQELGCELLYSEDLSHGQSVYGVKIVNPFRV